MRKETWWAVVLVMAMGPVATAAAQCPLPFGKNAVPEELRSDMSLPCGVSVNYTWMTDTIDLTDLQISLNGQPLPPGTISVADTVHHTNTFLGRFDAWLLPFLNVYGLAATLNGSANQIRPVVTPLPGLPALPIPASIDVSYHGHLVGIGATFAAGYRKFFASYDINREWVSVDAFDTTLHPVTQSVRAGVHGKIGKGKAAAYLGTTHLSLGGGAISGPSFFPGLPAVTFSLVMKPRQAWNTVAGGQVEITPHLAVIAEAGFGTRKQFTVMPGFRF